jgi:hypothetical protein
VKIHLILPALALLLITTQALFAQSKARALILTDIGGDTDDEQSLVRLLVYSNEIDIEGICATSRLGHGQDTRPEIARRIVRAYGQVRPNLLLHAPGYPTPESLMTKIKTGAGDQYKIGQNYDTEASDWIIAQVDKADRRPLWVCIWGGSRELAQALWKVQQTRTEAEADTFISRLRVHAIGDQDGHGQWIRENFNQLFYISSGFANHGDWKVREISVYRGQYMTGDVSMQDREWVRANIAENHGALGMMYPFDGHGTNGMKEGDTPSFTYLLPNGLQFPEEPTWGGWGGRFRKLANRHYVDDQDYCFDSANERHTVARWRPFFQRDFQARMNWCVKPKAGANHPPVVSINGDRTKNYVRLTANAGDRLDLDARQSSDPDGDALTYNWWFYPEPSQYRGCVTLQDSNAARTFFSVPTDAQGKTLHLILEVSDNGEPSLSSFRRVLIKVNE